MTIDLEKLVPMPEPDMSHRKAIDDADEELSHSSAQMSALRADVAREVAKACIMVMLGAMEEAEDKGASQDEQERAGFAAIAAEFGLEPQCHEK